jgi:hypothetical protein
MSHPTFPETFVVQRDEDVSGISGEGVIAEGCRFSDGWVVTHWLDQPPMHEPKTDVWHNKGAEPFQRIHGHDGRTRILWADDIAAARHKALADIVQAFDVPPELWGTEAEAAYWREQIERALRGASTQMRTKYVRKEWLGSVPGPTELKGYLTDFTDAVMPVLANVLQQRDRAKTAAGRAYLLADRWETAHGSANFLVRAAGAELRDELDGAATCDANLEPPSGGIVAGGPCIKRGLHDEHETADGTKFSPIGADHPPTELVMPWTGPKPAWADELRGRLTKEGGAAAAECSAQYLNRVETRLCIRAAQHRGDHIDEHGFHWSDTVAIYPIVDGVPACGRAAANSCSSPDHACKICGDCIYEHPGECGCGNVGLPRRTGAHPGPSLVEIADVVRSVLGIDVNTAPTDLNTWLLTACRQLEKSEDAREHLRDQRNAVAQALREALAVFHEVRTGISGEVLVHEASYGVHPSNFNRWRAALAGLPQNCTKPGGCSDCPHETGA